jgi:hypothetical protein
MVWRTLTGPVSDNIQDALAKFEDSVTSLAGHTMIHCNTEQ